MFYVIVWQKYCTMIGAVGISCGCGKSAHIIVIIVYCSHTRTSTVQLEYHRALLYLLYRGVYTSSLEQIELDYIVVVALPIINSDSDTYSNSQHSTTKTLMSCVRKALE